MFQEEIWKRIEWSPDYEISSWGRVKSYKQDKINGKLIKLTPSKNGYIEVNLYNIYTKKIKRIGVHRLVAEAFIPNPENKPEVNHIDEDKENNYYKNLNWMTSKENCNYGTRTERLVKKLNKPVRCIETGEIYSSVKEAFKQTNICQISRVCRGERLTAGGFRWEYIE